MWSFSVSAALFSPHGIAIPKGLYFTAVIFSSFFLSSLFSAPNLWGHWTDLNQTWTHIHLWLLFEKFGQNSPGISPLTGWGKTLFGIDFKLCPNISLQWNMISAIGKKTCQSTGTPYVPPNLVNFDPETAENGWWVFAHPLTFSRWETLSALQHGCYITDSTQTLTRVV